MYTFEQKYKFLLSFFEIQDIDYYEKDAMFNCTNSLHYFQFDDATDLQDKDNIVEWLMKDRKLKENK